MVLLPIRHLHRVALDLDVCILVPKSLNSSSKGKGTWCQGYKKCHVQARGCLRREDSLSAYWLERSGASGNGGAPSPVGTLLPWRVREMESHALILETASPFPRKVNSTLSPRSPDWGDCYRFSMQMPLGSLKRKTQSTMDTWMMGSNLGSSSGQRVSKTESTHPGGSPDINHTCHPS